LPPADVILAAPVTFNTVNKWAAGIADTLALGVITEGVGKHVPLVALPHVNPWQAGHSAFGRSVALLRGDGVDVVLGDDNNHRKPFPWDAGLDALERAAR
jgi:phosphopantothenoylcysteine synthetase/decarboxylase